MTAIEIIDETVEYYSNVNKRSVNGNYCKYLSDSGNKCAFSRCCTDEGVEHLHNYCEGIRVSEVLLSWLKPEYKGHSLKFWSKLQTLHDALTFWEDDGGLSEEGLEYVEELKEQFKTN